MGNNIFQAKRQSTVSAAHQGMVQIPTVRWTNDNFENNYDDDEDGDDDDDDNEDDDQGNDDDDVALLTFLNLSSKL